MTKTLGSLPRLIGPDGELWFAVSDLAEMLGMDPIDIASEARTLFKEGEHWQPGISKGKPVMLLSGTCVAAWFFVLLAEGCIESSDWVEAIEVSGRFPIGGEEFEGALALTKGDFQIAFDTFKASGGSWDDENLSEDSETFRVLEEKLLSATDQLLAVAGIDASIIDAAQKETLVMEVLKYLDL